MEKGEGLVRRPSPFKERADSHNYVVATVSMYVIPFNAMVNR